MSARSARTPFHAARERVRHHYLITQSLTCLAGCAVRRPFSGAPRRFAHKGGDALAAVR